MSRSETALTIGAVAREAGVTVEALRYYEREGLIGAPRRGRNGYRHFGPDAVDRVRFIKRAQDVGFTLNDVKELLALQARPGAACGDVRMRAAGKIREIEAKVATLQRMKAFLDSWVARCVDNGPVAHCPVLGALETKNGL